VSFSAAKRLSEDVRGHRNAPARQERHEGERGAPNRREEFHVDDVVERKPLSLTQPFGRLFSVRARGESCVRVRSFGLLSSSALSCSLSLSQHDAGARRTQGAPRRKVTVSNRIVIVTDDDQDIRECIVELLQEEEIDARGAEDGRAALDLLDTLGDDRCILLLDLMMPKMGGYEVIAHLERDGRLPALPVIVCTASKRAELPSSVRSVIQKPFVLEAILQALQDVATSALSEARLRADREGGHRSASSEARGERRAGLPRA
jgi:CheY-like chemotaxis protein